MKKKLKPFHKWGFETIWLLVRFLSNKIFFDPDKILKKLPFLAFFYIFYFLRFWVSETPMLAHEFTELNSIVCLTFEKKSFQLRKWTMDFLVEVQIISLMKIGIWSPKLMLLRDLLNFSVSLYEVRWQQMEA